MEDMHVQYITYLIMYPDCKADRPPFQGFLSLKTDHNQHLFSSIQIKEQKGQLCASTLFYILFCTVLFKFKQFDGPLLLVIKLVNR